VEIIPTKKHFFTLPPTLEDGDFAVKEYSVRRTAYIPMKLRTYGHSFKPCEKVKLHWIEALRKLSESSASHKHMCLRRFDAGYDLSRWWLAATLCVCFARAFDIAGASSLHAWGGVRARGGRKIAKRRRGGARQPHRQESGIAEKRAPYQ
jgi:hypothetical protein